MYGGGYGGGYLMMPVAYDAGVIQGLELSNTIRLSNYTFEIINTILFLSLLNYHLGYALFCIFLTLIFLFIYQVAFGFELKL